ncbi:MAG TPA: hypothetical protein VGQ80_18980 [Acidimicrobiia bacterium]|nr:hypothetical protein [Acidimicrobiia bacterium]
MDTPDALKTPGIGVAVGCSGCIAARLEDPDFDQRANPTTGEVFDHLRRVAEAKGWSYGVDGGRAVFVCPVCAAKTAKALAMPLPRYTETTRCPKCGHDQVGTAYCEGLTATCKLGAPGRGHLHRQCGRCRYEFIQGTLDEPIPATDPTDPTETGKETP